VASFSQRKEKMYVTSFATMFIQKAEIVPLDNLDLKPKIAIT
jgi:hypothetical protein